ncbi:MAG TPA: cytochrome c oxidase assembly protein [Afifellaceae bacterium]|nr:cytochrome c oxidase assembly protein [Afifellaceae bacterium]
MTGTRQKDVKSNKQANRRIAVSLLGVVAIMVGLAYASVPLYDMFCRVTGYGGTTQRAEAESQRVIDREVIVRFDANVAGLPWSFRPESPEFRLKVGAMGEIAYLAVNRSGKATAGTATFNVTPAAAGAYFNKIECFCFTSQELGPGERVSMPVRFFVDPAMDEDKDLDTVRTITLSYTFYPDAKAGQPVALSGRDEAGKKL